MLFKSIQNSNLIPSIIFLRDRTFRIVVVNAVLSHTDIAYCIECYKE